eukprot:TRINITY_DN690_c0_g1_i3.p1 TRINITY_DN690_c0_g1~~TRINITY_DN690_c0_g1_i3.p1  ORF type:complete len:199 (+),score=43.91 TRINITY_DN690_c0_g1_i3:244-840(+)
MWKAITQAIFIFVVQKLYCLIDSVQETEKMNDIVAQLKAECQKREECIAELHSIIEKEGDHYHISLSRPFALRELQIESFKNRLRTEIETEMKKGPFVVQLERFQWFTNDEKTRSFLALNCGFGNDRILKLISGIDRVMKDFGLKTFHEKPIPHATIAWTLDDILPQLKQAEGPLLEFISTDAEYIEFKCGKWIFKFS